MSFYSLSPLASAPVMQAKVSATVHGDRRRLSLNAASGWQWGSPGSREFWLAVVDAQDRPGMVVDFHLHLRIYFLNVQPFEYGQVQAADVVSRSTVTTCTMT